MTPFFQKKLILLDVDHTLIDWTNPKTLWDFRSEWKQKLIQSNQTASLRGHRTSIEHICVQTPQQKHIYLGDWVIEFVRHVQLHGWWVAIFSDFPQPLLMDWFDKLHLHHIAIGLHTGCLKPLPDGCYQLMSQLGVSGAQTFLIGDGLRTDSRAINTVGGHFIPIKAIRNKDLSELRAWIS